MLTGFPWALMGHIWIGTPVMQAAAWIGPVGLSILTCLAAASAFAAPQADWPKELNFGVIPVESSDNVTERFGNLAKYLEKQLGIPVKLQTATDYAGVIAAMQFKHIDLAYFGPKSYVEA